MNCLFNTGNKSEAIDLYSKAALELENGIAYSRNAIGKRSFIIIMVKKDNTTKMLHRCEGMTLAHSTSCHTL